MQIQCRDSNADGRLWVGLPLHSVKEPKSLQFLTRSRSRASLKDDSLKKATDVSHDLSTSVFWL